MGLFGGTFDPPHVGHVTVATDVADALELDRVLWMPAATSPFKVGEEGTDPALRLEMARAAAEADPRFRVRDDELRRGGVSWTVDTLRALRRELGSGAALYLILGADQLASFDRWREAEEILCLATPAIMDREGEDAEAVAPDLPGMERAVHVPVTRIDVSATRVRERIRTGQDVSGMLPVPVLRIVRREGLYRTAAPAAGAGDR